MIPPATSQTRRPVEAMPRVATRGDDIDECQRVVARELDAFAEQTTVAGGLDALGALGRVR